MPTTRQFGIVTSLTGLTGGIVVNSLSFNDNAQIAEARNEKGQIIDLAAYSNAKSVSIQGITDTSKGDLITAGSKITLGGKDWIVESVQKDESNTAFVSVNISARTADNAIITIITDGSSSSSESSSSGSGD